MEQGLLAEVIPLPTNLVGSIRFTGELGVGVDPLTHFGVNGFLEAVTLATTVRASWEQVGSFSAGSFTHLADTPDALRQAAQKIAIFEKGHGFSV